MAGTYIGDGSPEGTIVGRSAGKVGFFGTAPTVIATGFVAPVATGAATTSYGFTEAQANALIAWVRAADAELKAKGLISA